LKIAFEIIGGPNADGLHHFWWNFDSIGLTWGRGYKLILFLERFVVREKEAMFALI
jgi:hypothetical protein